MFRDKRVRSTAFFGPIILIFGIMFLISSVVGSLSKPQSVKVHVVDSAPQTWVEKFKAAKYMVELVPNEAAGKKLVEQGNARVVVVFDAVADGVQKVRLLHDESEQLGMLGVERVQAIFRASNESKLRSYLDSNRVPDGDVTEVEAQPVNVGTSKDKGAGQFLVGMLPYLIVIWAFYGGMGSASDLVAGEKDRSTLETLLISPVSRLQIVLGKVLALGLICFLSSLSSLVGLALFMIIKPPGSEQLLNKGLGLNFELIVLAVALLIPLVLMMASLLVLVSSYAKNSREAQTYLGLASFIIIMPALFSQFIGLTDYAKAAWVHAIPVLNVANQLRLALSGKPEWGGAAITILANGVIAAIALFAAVRMFQREELISKG
jgi:sodium transport system permease protein